MAAFRSKNALKRIWGAEGYRYGRRTVSSGAGERRRSGGIGMTPRACEDYFLKKIILEYDYRKLNWVPIGYQKEKGLRFVFRRPLIALVAGSGFEPETFGL